MEIEKDIFIPKRVLSVNVDKGHHWRFYNKIKKGWYRDLGLIIGFGKHHDKFRFLRIISYQPRDGNYDPDNHKGGCKPVLDTLKRMGWIRDDSGRWIHCEYDQRTVGEDGVREMGTRIILYDQQEYRYEGKNLRTCSHCHRKILSVLGFTQAILSAFNGEPGKCYLCGGEAKYIFKFTVSGVSDGRG